MIKKEKKALQKFDEALQACGFSPYQYSLLKLQDESQCLLQNEEGEWELFYFERGEKSFYKHFPSYMLLNVLYEMVNRLAVDLERRDQMRIQLYSIARKEFGFPASSMPYFMEDIEKDTYYYEKDLNSSKLLQKPHEESWGDHEEDPTSDSKFSDRFPASVLRLIRQKAQARKDRLDDPFSRGHVFTDVAHSEPCGKRKEKESPAKSKRRPTDKEPLSKERKKKNGPKK